MILAILHYEVTSDEGANQVFEIGKDQFTLMEQSNILNSPSLITAFTHCNIINYIKYHDIFLV